MFKVIVALFCSIAIFTGTQFYFKEFLVESKHEVILQGFFPEDNTLTVFSEDSNGRRKPVTSIDIEGKGPHVDQRFHVSLDGRPVEKIFLRFEADTIPVDQPSIHLHFIDFHNSFTKDLHFSHQGIRDSFQSDEFSTTELNRFDFPKTKPIITIASPELKNPDNNTLTTFVPLILGCITFLFFLKTNIASLPAYQDLLLGQQSSQSAQFNAINGLRGLSALLVLFSHTAPGFTSIKMGLALLFVLSGFLLTKPFVTKPTTIFSVKTIHNYLVKRCKRILPMYYFTIVIVYLVNFEFDIATRHFLFIEARGHLWAIPQILSFYLLLPLILMLTSAASKLHRAAPILLLFGLILLWRNYNVLPNLFYNGRYHTAFLLDSFLLGVLISYLQYGVILQSEKAQEFLTKHAGIVSSIALVFTVLTIAWSAPVDPPAWLAPYISRFDVKCLLASMIILFTVNTPQAYFSKLIGNPLFRSVGIVGFSFYLVQGLGIDMVLKFQKNILGYESLIYNSWSLTLSVLALTYIFSIFSYSYVERPFFGQKKRLDKK